MRYSPDTKYLAAGSYQIVTLWAAPRGIGERACPATADRFFRSRSRLTALTAYSGGQDKTIRVWSLAEGKLLRTLIGPVPVTAVASFRVVWRRYIGANDGTIRWLDSADGRERQLMRGHTGAVVDLAVLPDTKVACVLSRPPKTARHESGWSDSAAAAGGTRTRRRSAAVIDAACPDRSQGSVAGAWLAPDGQTVVTGGDDGTVRLWGARDGKPQGAHRWRLVTPGRSSPSPSVPDGILF